MHSTQNSTRINQILATLALATVSCLATAAAPVILNGTFTYKKIDTPVYDGAVIIGRLWQFEYTDSTITPVETLKLTVIKPVAGTTPYPGVVVSHGQGGNAYEFSTGKAKWFSPANYITIGVDYHHAGTSCIVPATATSTKCGGSPENIARAKTAISILHSQQLLDKMNDDGNVNNDIDIVNRDQTFLYGNSMGAMVTVELAQTMGSTLKAAAITAGGIFVENTDPAIKKHLLTPSGVAGVANMDTPLMQIHGTADTTVPFPEATRLSDALTANAKVHQAQWKIGADHSTHLATSSGDFVLAWFDTYRNGATPIISSVVTRKDRTTSIVQANIRGTGFGVNPAHDPDPQEQGAPDYPSYVLFPNVSQLIFDNDGTDTTAGTRVVTTTWANELINSVVPATVPSTGELSVTVPVGPLEINKAYFWDPIGGARSNLVKYTVPQ